MKIVVAPDSFKGSLEAGEVAAAIARGVGRAAPNAEIVQIPVADGGEGTVAAMVQAMGGQIIRKVVKGPLGRPVEGFFGRFGDTAVIEMAAASGLPLVPRTKRDPRVTTTYGTGELIQAALELGVKTIIMGLGGSATNDGGAGMAQALGARLLDDLGRPLPFGGAALANLARLDLSNFTDLSGVRMIIASDVDNPLCGPRGASAVFGPQKGATPEMVVELDRALANWASKLPKPVADLPGAGAAGGLSAALVALCGAELRRGIELVLEATQFEARTAGADLVITGEGRIDGQTLAGKVPFGVAQAAARAGAPAVAICGGIGAGYEALHGHNLAAVFSIAPGPVTLKEAIDRAPELLERAAEEIVRLWLIGRSGRR